VTPLRRVEAEVYASHAQFYVVDGRAGDRTADVWDGAGLERRLGVADGVVAVGTIGYGLLPVVLELWAERPREDLDVSDHVVEASLEVRTGRLALAGVEGPADAQPLEVETGSYRVRSARGRGGESLRPAQRLGADVARHVGSDRAASVVAVALGRRR
jgi:hypothetical protein